MGSKKHRNHSHEELMEQRAADDRRHHVQKPVKNIGMPSPIAPTVLFNPFRSNLFLHNGIVIVRAPLPEK